MTNADRIRAMTDEELVEEVFGEHIKTCACPPNDGECQDACEKCWLDWLKEEAQDG